MPFHVRLEKMLPDIDFSAHGAFKRLGLFKYRWFVGPAMCFQLPLPELLRADIAAVQSMNLHMGAQALFGGANVTAEFAGKIISLSNWQLPRCRAFYAGWISGLARRGTLSWGLDVSERTSVHFWQDLQVVEDGHPTFRRCIT